MITNLQGQTAGAENIAICCNDKTLEYSLAHENPGCEILITECCTNEDKLQQLMEKIPADNEFLDRWIQEDCLADLRRLPDETEKERSVFATAYLTCVENAKGEHALELASNLRDNLNPSNNECSCIFRVPSYFKEAIIWVCRAVPDNN